MSRESALAMGQQLIDEAIIQANKSVKVQILGVKKMAEESKNPFANVDVGVLKQGTQIILPAQPVPMTEEQAIVCLQRKMERDKTVVAIHEEVDAFPLDGAHAFMKVLESIYGWTNPVAKKTFFGDQPPTMVNLETGFGENSQVIWGEFEIPGIKGRLETGVGEKHGRKIFVITGKVWQKHQDEIKEIARLVREYVKTSSIYKGKAIRLNTDNEGDIVYYNPPTFIDLSRVNEAELTFSDEVKLQVETNLFTPVERTEECRKHKIPLKRGILLEGPYGTGKTLTAYVTAKKAAANGWTFIYLDRVTGLKECLVFARQYMPAVIFAEDIDRVMGEERDVNIDDILNHIDGVDSKGSEILTILTTNFVEKIDKAMLRPGRLDAVISVKPPDAAAAQKLMRLYARGLIAETENLEAAGAELAGQIPAVIREAVERSKLYAIGRNVDGEEFTLKGSDVAKAARGMKAHLDLLQNVVVETSIDEKLGQSVRALLHDVVINSNPLNGTKELIEHTHELCEEHLN